jgi:hypothetical protein
VFDVLEEPVLPEPVALPDAGEVPDVSGVLDVVEVEELGQVPHDVEEYEVVVAEPVDVDVEVDDVSLEEPLSAPGSRFLWVLCTLEAWLSDDGVPDPWERAFCVPDV